MAASFSQKTLNAQTYDENPLYDYEDSEQNDSDADLHSFSEIPADMQDNKITVPTDPVSQSFYTFTKALIDENNNDIDEAISGFKKTMEAEPENLYVYQHAVQTALDYEKYEEAEKWADYLIKKDPETSQNWVYYGNAKWANEHHLEAAQAYTHALKLDKNNTEALFQFAALIGTEEPTFAMSMLERFKKLRPDDSYEADYRIAILYNENRNLRKTEQYLLKAVAANPYHLQSWYALAELYEIKGDNASAVKTMETIASLEPSNTRILKRLAETWMETDTEKAREYFERIKKIDKTDSDACFWLAAEAEDRQDFKEAAAQLEDSATLWSQPDLLMRLSFYYTQMDKYKEGVELLEKAYEKFPDNENVAYYLALGLDDLGNTQKSYNVLYQLVNSHPENKDYLFQLGQVCEKLDKIAEMELNFKKFLEIDPENTTVLNFLGYSLADRNIKLEEAKQYIEKAVSLAPETGEYIDSLAWVNFRLGNLKKASEEIIKAKNIISDDYIIWDHYGDIFNALEDSKEAWKAWKIAEFLSKDKEQKKIQEKTAAIEKKIPNEEASLLRTSLYKALLPAGKDFSAFGTLESKAKGKKIKLDIILSYSAPDKLKMTFLSPFYTPAGFAEISGDQVVFSAMPDIQGMEKYKESMQSWLSIMMMELRDFYMGKYNKANVKKWKSSSYIAENGAKVSLNDYGIPTAIKSARNKKIKMNLKEYENNAMYIFPYEIEYKIPFVKVKITLKHENMKFNFKNDLRTFVKMQP